MAPTKDLQVTFLLVAGTEVVPLNDGTPFFSRSIAGVTGPEGQFVNLALVVEGGEVVIDEFLMPRNNVNGKPIQTVTFQTVRAMSTRHVWDKIMATGAASAATWTRDRSLENRGEPWAPLSTYEREQLEEVKRRAVAGQRVWRAVTPQLLAEVAGIVQANPHRPKKAVAEKMYTSERNATRWIAAAVDAGKLPDYRKGR
jgi:hypothetical protein